MDLPQLTQKTDEYEVKEIYISEIVVCSCLSEKKVLKAVSIGFPAGYSGNWKSSGKQPTRCPVDENNQHYLFIR